MSKQQAANDSAVEEELGLIGATAEDTEAELIRKICETELLAGNKTTQHQCIGTLTTNVLEPDRYIGPTDISADIIFQTIGIYNGR